METQLRDDDPGPERRGSDEHTRQIVKMTVHEIFDGVGVDFSTPEGRQRFRDNIGFLDDARAGTRVMRRTLLGGVATASGITLYKIWPAFLLWLSR